MRVWLRETKVHCMAALAAAAVTRRLEYFTKRLSVSSCTHDISMVHLDYQLVLCSQTPGESLTTRTLQLTELSVVLTVQTVMYLNIRC